MTIRVGINGFGRIGRLAMRIMAQEKDIEIVGINDLVDAATLAYLFKYDTVHGRYQGEVQAVGTDLIIDGRTIPTTALKSPAELPWKAQRADIIIESTGKFTKGPDAKLHLEAGAQKVLISAPAKGEDVTLVMGVNHEIYDPAAHNIISNASCTTNCLAPLAKVVNDKFEIVEGLMTTIHAATASQGIVDVPNKKPRSGRAVFNNIIPASTGAAEALGKVIPALNGRLTGMAFRVPVVDVSVVDLTVKLAKPAEMDEINALYKAAADGELKGILKYTDENVVSSDFTTDPHSCIYDSGASIRLNGTFFKLIGWYDNEWGYSCRLVDLLRYVADRL